MNDDIEIIITFGAIVLFFVVAVIFKLPIFPGAEEEAKIIAYLLSKKKK